MYKSSQGASLMLFEIIICFTVSDDPTDLRERRFLRKSSYA